MTVILVDDKETMQYTVEVYVEAVPEFSGSETKKEIYTPEEEE